ncbi:hypothetical protein X801_07582, partial [Opisthorchis viverrini]
HTLRRSSCSAVKILLYKSYVLYSAHNLHYLCEPLSEWKVNEDEVNCKDVLKVKSQLAAAADSGGVQIFDMSSGQVVQTLKKHDNICSVTKFRPLRSWQLISGGLDWKGTDCSPVHIYSNKFPTAPPLNPRLALVSTLKLISMNSWRRMKKQTILMKWSRLRRIRYLLNTQISCLFPIVVVTLLLVIHMRLSLRFQ